MTNEEMLALINDHFCFDVFEVESVLYFGEGPEAAHEVTVKLHGFDRAFTLWHYNPTELWPFHDFELSEELDRFLIEQSENENIFPPDKE